MELPNVENLLNDSDNDRDDESDNPLFFSDDSDFGGEQDEVLGYENNVYEDDDEEDEDADEEVDEAGDEDGDDEDVEDDDDDDDDDEDDDDEYVSDNGDNNDDYDEDADDDDGDEDFEEEEGATSLKDVLKQAMQLRKRKRGKEKDPEVRMKLSKANEAYVSGEYDLAMQLYEEVVKLDPKNHQAYHAIGDIFKLRGDDHNCCASWFLAAELDSRNSTLWATCGDLSLSLNYIRQAFYCYSKAVMHDTKKHEYLWTRTRLYLQYGKTAKALRGFQKLAQLEPRNQKVAIELAKLYSLRGRVGDALNMYLEILNKNISYYGDRGPYAQETKKKKKKKKNKKKEKRDFSDFGWSQLNILAELFLNQKSYQSGLEILKQTSRWLQGRADETFWEKTNPNDDAEFDDRRFQNRELLKMPNYDQRLVDLPIDIRVKLGVFRIKLGYVQEAKMHFDYLNKEPSVNEVADLYIQAGNVLEECSEFSTALEYYIKASGADELVPKELAISIANCQRETGDYASAVESYRAVRSYDSDSDTGVLSALLESLFYIVTPENSKQILMEVEQLTKEHAARMEQKLQESMEKGAQDSQTNDSEDELVQNSFAFLPDLIQKKAKSQAAPALKVDKEEVERRLVSDTMNKYNRMQKLIKNVKEGDLIASRAWLQIASELIESFCELRQLFTRERIRAWDLVLHGKKSNGLTNSQRLAKLSKMHQLTGGYGHVDPSLSLKPDESFRGLTFDKWFEIFMDYVLTLVQCGEYQDAKRYMDLARLVSVFTKDPEKENILKIMRVSVDHLTQNYDELMVSVRDVLNSNQFSRDSYRFFNYVLGSGRRSFEMFISLNHQKYFLRQTKAWESLRLKNNSQTMDCTSLHPYLMVTYAQVLLAGKSYYSALTVLIQTYQDFKNDPMICLLLAIGFLHRAMQRSSGNRHMLILQAVSFLTEYKRLRKDNVQEVYYNIGRFFHQINLTSAAVRYYKTVLEMEAQEENDLKKEAAYNLYLVYSVNGNMHMAKSLLEKYLTV